MPHENLFSYQREADWTNGADGSSPKNVTVIIPTYNVKKSLRNTLLSLAQQTYPSRCFEVLIVDNGSTDGVLEMLGELALPFLLRYYYQERAGRQVGKTRNVGIANAAGDIVIFVDADCMCSSNLIEAHVRLQEKGNYLGIGEIRMLDPNGCLDRHVKIELATLVRKKLPTQMSFKGRVKLAVVYWLRSLFRGFSVKMIYWMSGGNSSVRRKYLWAAGGYDEDFDFYWGDEDAELGYRIEKLGVAPKYLPEAMIFHQWHKTSKSGVPGRNRILFLLKHPELARVRWLMQSDNEYFRKSPEELRVLLATVEEKARNYYASEKEALNASGKSN